MMAPGHRLCCLQVGEARHHPISTGLGLREKRSTERAERLIRLIALVADPKPEIDGNLIVP